MGIIKKISFGKNGKGAKNPGKFVVIDGTDGSGKATQTEQLVKTLKDAGYAVEMTDFPQYGNKSAGMIEEYLNNKYGQVNAYAASIFYAVDRFDASFKIREWLNEGKIVIANRYVTANAGHQGGKITDSQERIKFFRWLDNLEYNTFGIPKPDLNIILHVPAQMAQKLVDNKDEKTRKYANGKKRDLHEADLAHLKNAESAYIEISKLFPNTKLVECVERGKLLTPAEIHNKVWELVRRIALKNLLPPLNK
jgi:dTMP kinase